MTPEQLDAMLKTLRANGVASAEVPVDWSSAGVMTLRVVFAPDAGPLPGDKPEPGGWKSPSRLDRDPLADENEVP